MFAIPLLFSLSKSVTFVVNNEKVNNKQNTKKHAEAVIMISLKLSMKHFLFECFVADHLHFEMKVINFYCDECFLS